jgi:hypothetical protein
MMADFLRNLEISLKSPRPFLRPGKHVPREVIEFTPEAEFGYFIDRSSLPDAIKDTAAPWS